MAASKKKVKQKNFPAGKKVVQQNDPSSYYSQHPSWNFKDADKEKWQFDKENVGELFWKEILPRLQAWESQTWREILVNDKNNNHSIDNDSLNKDARDRLSEKCIEAESIISLRVNGTHRIYGYMTGLVFNILWFDDNHGDNDKCVCRSRKKHT